jgi:hypothetical protein
MVCSPSGVRCGFSREEGPSHDCETSYLPVICICVFSLADKLVVYGLAERTSEPDIK